METVAVRRVCIPVASTAPGVGSPAHSPVILIALEDENLRQAASRVLAGAGYRVLTARHAGHALLACLTNGRIDVLISELRMNDGSGPALAARLRRHNPDLRGVYFSNDRNDACHEVLVRPVTADALLQAVERADRR